MSNKKYIVDTIAIIKKNIMPILDFDLNSPNIFAFDFSENNNELKNINLDDTEDFSNYIFEKMKKNNTPVAIGLYNENRRIYARSNLFTKENNPRTVHLGIDLWAKAGSYVYAPINGKVHSFKNNDKFGDFGPTIILEHTIKNVNFFTLYGHLSLDSIQNIENEKEFRAGEKIAEIGDFPINGNWPPHLHFQIITDMQNKNGDFYGVASTEDSHYFLNLCPDPNLILNIKFLQ